MDLIFGLPGQEATWWRQCLDSILLLEPDHISAYGLQLEEGTPLFRDVETGVVDPCEEEEELTMFWDTMQILSGAGYEHYEISNYARSGKKCRHNLIYWHNGEYLGLGPGAHSHLGNIRRSNEPWPGNYAPKVAAGHLPVSRRERLDEKTAMAETVFLGLRLLEGLELKRFTRRFGRSLTDVYRKELDWLMKENLVEIKDGLLRLTPRGLPVANRVFMEFLFVK